MPSEKNVAEAVISEAEPGALRLLHTITGLSIGGAEWMLCRLLTESDRQRFAPTVMSLLSPGAVARRIEALGVSVVSLGMREGRPQSLPVLRLGWIQRWLRPDLMQGWIYQGNLAATFGWRSLECPPV